MSEAYKNDFQIFSADQIESLRKGGKILHDTLEHVAGLVTPGVTTGELDVAAEKFIRDRGGEPGFKGYRNYPATLCTSVNEICVHGLPSEDSLKEGDIVGVDCGVFFDGLYTDACITIAVGEISHSAQNLMMVTKKALKEGIKQVRAGAHVGDVSSAIHKTLKSSGFDAMRQLTGHGLGDTLHQFPEIFNFGNAGTGPVFPENTIVAIEPISTVSSTEVRESKDGWSLAVKDGGLSAHYEHTVIVLSDGCEVLT